MSEHDDQTQAVPAAPPRPGPGPRPGPVAVTGAVVAGSLHAGRPAAPRPGPGDGVRQEPSDLVADDPVVGAGVRRDGSGATGDHAVDEALTRLESLAGSPLREHVAVFDAVHSALQDRLADTEG